MAWSPLLLSYVLILLLVPGDHPQDPIYRAGVIQDSLPMLPYGAPVSQQVPHVCQLLAVASSVKGVGVQGELAEAAHLHPPQLLVG